MSETEPLWKLPSNQHLGNCVENGHVTHHGPYASSGKLFSSSSIGSISNNGTGGGGGSGSINSSGATNSNGGNVITRCCFHLLKCVNVRRCVAALVLLTVVTIVYYTHYVDNSPFVG